MTSGLVKHFFTGVWVMIFGLVAIPLYLLWSGTVVIGGLSDNPAILTLIGLLALPVCFIISGWAARMGVERVK
jgi:surface polysaccharide O-acyltransferase-like enzyme